MILTYSVFSEEIETKELGKYRTYGIIALDDQGNILKAVHDVSCDLSKLEPLVELCNRFQLSLCHLCDVVEDFMI